MIDYFEGMNTGTRYDLLVLGAGPVGVKAAVECANRGYRVGLIDPKETITGAPTGAHSKCLREAAMEGARTWEEVEHVIDKVVSRTSEATNKMLQTFHIDLLKGKGSFIDQETVLYEPCQEKGCEFYEQNQELKADCIVIATGSKSFRLPGVPFHRPGVYDSDTIGQIKYLPKSMCIQGAGIIGIEYALIFSLLGSKVTIIHRADDFAPMVDKDLRAALLAKLERHGVNFRLCTDIKSVTAAEGTTEEWPWVLVETNCGDVVQCDAFLSATGRVGASEGIGLENLEHLGMKVGRGNMVEVNKFNQTGVPNIYAVGDVAGGGLATQGQSQATRAIQAHFGLEVPDCTRVKPAGVWTIPEIAWAGITEDEAIKQGIEYDTAIADYCSTIRGIVANDKGFLKLVFCKNDGKVLGVHVCGEGACDIVNYGAEVVSNHDTVSDVERFVFPAVTYHELYSHAAHKAQIYLRGVKCLAASTAWNRVKVAFRKGGLSEGQLHKAFMKFDDDDSGCLHACELQGALEALQFRISREVVEAMVEEVAQDGADAVTWDDFKKVVMSQ
jgi:NAD(P) transhydrogenase